MSQDQRDVERLTLGIAMQSAKSLDTVRDVLEPDDFADVRHGEIFRALCLHVDTGGPCEPVAICGSIIGSGVKLPSGSYIAELWSDGFRAPGEPGWYAEKVAKASEARRLQVVAAKISQAAASGQVELAASIIATAARVTSAPQAVPRKTLGIGATPMIAGCGYARRFPVEALPKPMRDYIVDVAHRTQVPVDLPALTALGIIGSVAGPRMIVRRDLDWVQPTNLYTIVAMASGGAKSPAVGELRDGLNRAQDVMTERRKIATGARVVELKNLAEKLYREANVSADEARTEALRMEARRVEQEVQELESQDPPRAVAYFDGDVTIEALGAAMARNDGWGSVIDDEGTLFRTLSGLYSGGKTGNLGLVLVGYDCRYHRPQRVSRECQPISRAALSLVVSPQPGIVAEMLRNSVMDEVGFVNRFLVSIPGDLVGQRKDRGAVFVDDEPESRPAAVGRLWWSTLLADIAAYDVIGDRDPKSCAVIDLTRDAFDLHVAYERKIEDRLRPGVGDLVKVKPWASKHLARVLRISALLHLAEGMTADDRISPATMASAVTIGEWSIEHYAHAANVCGLSDGAERIREYVDQSAAGIVARSEISSEVFRRNAGKADLDGWIDELVKTGDYEVRALGSGRGRRAECVCRVEAES